MNNIELSFCIPTYNRVQSVLRLVTDILSCEDLRIEVVVLDNGSTDDTLSVLGTIKDERLLVYSNGENKGALYNMVNVLNKGRGKYLVYSTDQDYVDKNKIAEFKLFLLQTSELACGYCEFNSVAKIESKIFSVGYDAVRSIAYKGRHPTGYFFNKKLLKSINLVERFSDYNFVDLFPLEFVFAELCLLGNGAIYYRPTFIPETGAMVVKHRSSTTNGKSDKAFFSPEARLKLAISYVKHINTLKLKDKEKELLRVDVFIRGLAAGTVGYRSVVINKDLCIHYHMDSREVGVWELFEIGVKFYTRFVDEVVGFLGYGHVKRAKFKMAIFFGVIKKLLILMPGRLF